MVHHEVDQGCHEAAKYGVYLNINSYCLGRAGVPLKQGRVLLDLHVLAEDVDHLDEVKVVDNGASEDVFVAQVSGFGYPDQHNLGKASY